MVIVLGFFWLRLHPPTCWLTEFVWRLGLLSLGLLESLGMCAWLHNHLPLSLCAIPEWAVSLSQLELQIDTQVPWRGHYKIPPSHGGFLKAQQNKIKMFTLRKKFFQTKNQIYSICWSSYSYMATNNWGSVIVVSVRGGYILQLVKALPTPH